MKKQETLSYKLTIEKGEKSLLVFDPIRRKRVKLTPEEGVRQQFIQFLVVEKEIPVSLIAIEKKLVFQKMTKRADIVVFDKKAQPRIIVECKAPAIAITQDVFDQIARYNMVYNADYLVVTNGSAHFCCKINFQNNSYIFVKDIPHFNEL